MKRLTIALAAVVLTAAQASLAQPPAGGPPPGGNPVDRLAQELSLTPAQKDKVTQIFEDQRKKREAQRAADQSSGQTLTPEQRQGRFQAAQQEMLTALGGVLTPAQLAKYKEIQAQRRPGGSPPASN